MQNNCGIAIANSCSFAQNASHILKKAAAKPNVFGLNNCKNWEILYKPVTELQYNNNILAIYWSLIFFLLLFLDFPPTKQFQSDTDICGIFFTFNSMLKKQKRGVILKTTGLIWKINQYDCVNFVKRSEHKSVPIHPPYSCVSVKCSRRGGAIRSYCEVVPVEDLLFWKLDDILHSHFCLFQKIQHLIMRNTNQ